MHGFKCQNIILNKPYYTRAMNSFNTDNTYNQRAGKVNIITETREQENKTNIWNHQAQEISTIRDQH